LGLTFLKWFAIPFLAATTMGLAALALEGNPVFPTFPDRMDPADVSAGLVLPTAAVAMMGKGGAAAALILVFMAVTSASSAEFIAVSTLWTYDVYKTYMKPTASGRSLIYMSHCSVIVFAILMASFSVGLHYIGISMGYLYLLMGVIISSAVLPAALTLLWSKQNWWAATLSPVLGLAVSLIAWLVTAKTEGGTLSVATTGANYPMLAGNVAALLSPCIFVPILTYALGADNYDWKSMAAISRGDDHDLAAAANIDLENVPGGHKESTAEAEAEEAMLVRAAKIARYLTLFLTVALLVLWPMPMYGSSYVFSKKFFTGWIVVGILWMFFASFAVGVYPLWEGRHTMKRTFKAIVADLSGKPKLAVHHADEIEETGTSTPTEKVLADVKTG
jgi:Na+/proline symporter